MMSCKRIDVAALLIQWLGIALISAFLVALPSLAGLIGTTKGVLKPHKGAQHIKKGKGP